MMFNHSTNTITDPSQLLRENPRDEHPRLRCGRSWAKRTRKLVAAIAFIAIGTGAFGVATTAPVSAKAETFNFEAICNVNGLVTASHPDLRYTTGKQVWWFPTLYQWTSQGWVKYRAPLPWLYTASPVTTFDNWYYKGDYEFSNLPRGYYQVRITMRFYFKGVLAAYTNDAPTIHELGTFNLGSYLDPIGAMFNQGAVDTTNNSTKDYCYVS